MGQVKKQIVEETDCKKGEHQYE
jgi:hypothetical protein